LIEKRGSEEDPTKLMRLEDLSSNLTPKEKAKTANQMLVKDGAGSLLMIG